MDGQTYLSVASDDDGWLWNPVSGERSKRIEARETYAMCTVPLDGRTTLATSHAYGDVHLWEPHSSTPVGKLSGHAAAVNALTVIDERLLATASSEQRAATARSACGDLANQAQIEEIPVHHPALAVTWVAGRLIVGLDHGLLAVSIKGLIT